MSLIVIKTSNVMYVIMLKKNVRRIIDKKWPVLLPNSVFTIQVTDMLKAIKVKQRTYYVVD